MRRRVLMAVAATGYSKLIIAATQFALVPVLALQWGLAVYGQWLMLASVPLFLAASDFGFGGAAGVRIIGEVARDELHEALCTFQSALVLVLSATITMTAVSLTISLLVPAQMLEVDGGTGGDQARSALMLLCLYGLCTLSGGLFTAVARAHGFQAQSIFLVATVQLLESLAVLGVALSGGDPVQAASALLGVALLGQVANVCYAARVAPWIRFGHRHALLERILELVRPAFGLMMWPLSQALYLQGTVMATGAAGGAALVPIVTSIRTLARTATQLMLAVSMPLMPDYTAAHATGNVRRMELIGGLLAIMNVLFGLASGLLLALFGPAFLRFWTDGAMAAPHLMFLIVAVGMPMSLLWNSLANLLIALNRHEIMTYWFAAIAAITVGLTYVCVFAIGLTGAALANLILEFSMTLIVLVYVGRRAGRLDVSLAPVRAMVPARYRGRLPFDL